MNGQGAIRNSVSQGCAKSANCKTAAEFCHCPCPYYVPSIMGLFVACGKILDDQSVPTEGRMLSYLDDAEEPVAVEL